MGSSDQIVHPLICSRQVTQEVHCTYTEVLDNAKNNLSVHQAKSPADDILPTPDELFEFTHSFEMYAEQVLPPQQASRPTRSPVPSSTSRDKYRGVRSERKPSVAASSGIPNQPLSQMPGSHSETSVSTEQSTFWSSNQSSRNQSSRLSANPLIVISSVSDISPASSKVARPSSSCRNERLKTEQSKNDHTSVERNGERIGYRAREYINDPDGTILSPPKVKPRFSSAPPEPFIRKYPLRRTEQIGRHTISINDTKFYLNEDFISFENHATAEAFFDALIANAGKLDSLEQALIQRNDWDEVSGWVVDFRDSNPA